MISATDYEKIIQDLIQSGHIPAKKTRWIIARNGGLTISTVETMRFGDRLIATIKPIDGRLGPTTEGWTIIARNIRSAIEEGLL